MANKITALSGSHLQASGFAGGTVTCAINYVVMYTSSIDAKSRIFIDGRQVGEIKFSPQTSALNQLALGEKEPHMTFNGRWAIQPGWHTAVSTLNSISSSMRGTTPEVLDKNP